MGFYRNTIKRYAEAGGNRIAKSGNKTDTVALTPEECEWALQGNPPPDRCRREVEALHCHWIVTVQGKEVRVTRAGADFDPGI